MLGFLVLVFMYLFLLLAKKTEKKARPSLIRSIVMAGAFIGVLSIFSVVTLGVVFLIILFIPFFLFPTHRTTRRFHFRNQSDSEKFKDFFEEMNRQQHNPKNEKAGYKKGYAGRSEMSVDEASKLLGLPEGATHLQIKSAYRKMMMRHHPDKGGSAEFAAKLNTARDVMMFYVSDN